MIMFHVSASHFVRKFAHVDFVWMSTIPPLLVEHLGLLAS